MFIAASYHQHPFSSSVRSDIYRRERFKPIGAVGVVQTSMPLLTELDSWASGVAINMAVLSDLALHVAVPTDLCTRAPGLSCA